MNTKDIKKNDPLGGTERTEEKSDADLRELQSILSTAEEVAQMGSWRWDLRTQKVTWSEQMFRLFGVDPKGFDGDVDRVVSERIHPDDAAAVLESNQSGLDKGDPIPLSYRIVLPDGTQRTVWAQGKLIRDETGKPIALIGYVQDITERVQAEKKILQLKRLYATLSQINQTIVRVKDTAELYQSICDVAVKFGELSASWIGLLDEGTGELRPAAACGFDLNHWPMPIVNINNDAHQSLLATEALRTSNLTTSEDIQTDERTKNLHEQLRRTEFHSLAAVPFHLQGKAVGVLNLLSAARGFFTSEEEKHLLDEMGMDISFALDVMENERVRRQWADAFEHCSHGIVIGNPRTNEILTCNPAFVRAQGGTMEELRAMPFFKMYAPQDHERIKQFLAQSDREGSVRFEAQKVRMDGSTYQVQMDLVSVRDENGNLLYRVATQQDITERRRAESALIQSEERFRILFDRAPLGYQSLDADGKFIDVNQAWLDTLGYTREEVLGHWFGEFLSPQYVEAFRERFPLFKAAGQIHSEFEMLHKDGTRHWIAFDGRIGYELNGDFKQTHCILQDITERRQAELLLKRNERVLRLFVEHSPAAIAMFDRDMKYIIASRRYLVDYGLGEQDLTGRSHYEVFPEIGERWKEVHRRCLAGAIERAEEDPFPRADGRMDWVHWEIHPWYEDAGKIGGIILFSEVVTERKRAQEALRAADEKYRNIFENVMEAITQTTVDGRYITANPAAARIMGYDSPEEMIASVSDLDRQFYVKPGRREEFRKLMEKYGGVSGFESEVYRKDGIRIWIQENSRAVYDEHGSLLYYEGTAQEITERKEAEREIQQRTEDLLLINALNEAANRGEDIQGIAEAFVREARSIFNCQNAAIYLLSPDGKYLEMQSSTLSRKLTDRIETMIGRAIPRIQIPLREDSYFKQMLESEQGTIVNDAQSFRRWIEEFTETTFLPQAFRAPIRRMIPQIQKSLDIHSAIVIPLISSGRKIGILDMSSKGEFSENDLIRVRNLSRQMTAVLLRKQAERHVEVQLQRLRALSEIDRAISSSLDMYLSLDILLNQTLSQLEVDAACVLLLDPSSQALEYADGKGFYSTAIRRSRILLGQDFAGKAGLERHTVHVPDLASAGGQFTRSELLKEEAFVEYIGVPLIGKGILKGVLEIFHRSHLAPDAEWMNYLETLGGQAAIAIENAQLFEGMQRSNLDMIVAYDATIEGWSRAMDLRDKETEGHTVRVTEMTVQLAKKMGVSQHEITQMRRGALLHDIGKLGVPDHILHKTEELDRLEWAIMRQHPTYAFNMLLPINYLRPALDIPYSHHEKWDGTGYPRGLKGEQIPLAARIFAIVDVWDALRSDRPYRNGWAIEKIREYLIAESGKHFDPRVVKAFLDLLNEFPDLR